MTTRNKDEQQLDSQLLDEKIARIQRQNEKILLRQKEIEEDKRLAEQQNAVVKLRSSTTNVSRERTPALKPSNREIREDDDPEPVIQRSKPSPRASFRGRGGERFRGQGDWKTNGPPPDPKSFLYDDQRDAPARDREDRGDSRRGRREEGSQGGREFQRGARRRERGNRAEDAWRAERMRIDEARIQRQRSADGKWRREWDCDKTMQETSEEQRQEHCRPTNPPQSQMYFPPDICHHPMARGGTRGGRGRGRLDIKELELSMENFKLDVSLKQVSPPAFANDAQSSQWAMDAPPPDRTRSIQVIGNTVKVSIPNSALAQSSSKGQRPRGRFRLRPSCSSQSDEESPQDRGSRRHHRNQRIQKTQPKNSSNINNSSDKSPELLKNLPAGEESWEDMPTSGEELSSNQSSPIKSAILNTMLINSTVQMEPVVAEMFGDHHEKTYVDTIDQYVMDKVGVDTLPSNESYQEITRLSNQDLTDELLRNTEESGKGIDTDMSNTISQIEMNFEIMCKENENLLSLEKNEQMTASSDVEHYCSIVTVKDKSLLNIENGIEVNDYGKEKNFAENQQAENSDMPFIASVGSKEEEDLEIHKFDNNRKGGGNAVA